MQESPLISICIPVYNAGSYLAEAIESALNQSYSNVDIVICDNVSSDDSADIAHQYAHNSPKVRFVQNHWNIGYSGNAHKATALGMGDFIIMHGADDYLLPGALQQYVELIRNSNTDPTTVVLMSDLYLGDAQGNIKERFTLSSENNRIISIPLEGDGVQRPRVEHLQGQSILSQRLPELVSFGGVGSVMVSRQLYTRVEGYTSNHWFNPDKHFIYKVLSLNPRVIWLREPLYYYRVHESNQLSLQRGTGVLRQLMDEYAYTFEFNIDFYEQFSPGQDSIIQRFVEYDCLRPALRELAVGNRKFGFRHLCFALATYPDFAWRDNKTYLALLTWLTGPVGRLIARIAYQQYKIKTGSPQKEYV